MEGQRIRTAVEGRDGNLAPPRRRSEAPTDLDVPVNGIRISVSVKSNGSLSCQGGACKIYANDATGFFCVKRWVAKVCIVCIGPLFCQAAVSRYTSTSDSWSGVVWLEDAHSTFDDMV